MALNDDKLILLEQLTYLNSDVAKAAGIGDKYRGIENFKNCTIEQFLSQFSEEALEILENSEETISYVQGNEWAAVIRTLKNDKTLKDLKITDIFSNSNGKTVAICFYDTDGSDQAVVAFRGTLDGEEWIDNVEGLNTTDTKCQKEALAYIESLPYDNIIVVGHSKGGNKAQYVTICSDKVTRCVSMDGQGFSQEFIDKYWAEIQQKRSAIKNYSLNNDYVHILLFPIPGSEQLYFAGDGMENGWENHSPNSFFYLTTDDEGHAVLQYDENGIYLNAVNAEYSSIAYLHGFVNFVLNVMPDGDKTEVVSYLGTILSIAMGGGSIEIDGVTYNQDNIIEYILSDPETASLVAAYLIDYIDIYELSEDQVYDLLEAFGMGDLVSEIQTAVSENRLYAMLLLGCEGLLGVLLEKITDGKDDPLISGLLDWLSFWLKENKDINFDFAEFWKMTEEKYGSIGYVDKKSANQNATARNGKKMNFSKEMYELLISTIDSFETAVFGDVSSWSNYSSEEWYSFLGISVARRGINLYIDKLSDINRICMERIESVFSNEWAVDNNAAEKITALVETLDNSISGYEKLIERLAL